MKTIKDLSIRDINEIYSIIIGEPRVAGKVDWSEERDFVVAVFKVEESTIAEYSTVEYGLQIDEELNVTYVWWWNTHNGRTAIDYRPLYNHHKITRYLMDSGFDV